MDNNFNDPYNGYTDNTYTPTASGNGYSNYNDQPASPANYNGYTGNTSAPQGEYNGYTYSNATYYSGPSIPETLPTDEDTTPISVLGYIGYYLLFSIPTVGLVVAIVFATGASKNINVKNFARAMLIVKLVSIALFLLVYGSMFAWMMHEIN
ncbi:MAG: hypothetical protein K6C99_07785 [Lachnospiraceae bacterium]|nr:hypothetical protein [Lachnospiraceae bacterium]